nr:DNA topoisomerase IB [Pelagibacterium limicola]
MAAAAAELCYVSDAEPGIARRRAGKGFRYSDPEGKPVRDEATLGRIRRLAIPPAWTDVWICPTESGHIQATGRDQRGRKQYRYHERWSAIRDAAKFSSLIGFARALPDIRAQVDRDLRRRGLPRERVLASIVWLLDQTMIRIGNAAYAETNKSFGLTTLRTRHVEIEGAKLRFAFKGKSGKLWRLKLVDRRIARVLRGIQELPGQRLFQYIDSDGQRRGVGSNHVNAYIQECVKGAFSSKDFRTWGGTVRAMSVLAETEVPDTQRARAATLNSAIDAVARHLGNTRAVCRKCYIHPAIPEAWLEGRLKAEVSALSRRPRKGLDGPESLTLRWLEKQC